MPNPDLPGYGLLTCPPDDDGPICHECDLPIADWDDLICNGCLSALCECDDPDHTSACPATHAINAAIDARAERERREERERERLAEEWRYGL